MSRASHVVLSVPAAILLASALHSFSAGIDPLSSGIANLNRALPSCGGCHLGVQGQNNLRVRVDLSAHSLAPGQAISITTSATGGTTDPQLRGGFSSDVTAGTFTAGANTRVAIRPDAISHSQRTPGRSWTYGYVAPLSPGPVEMFVTVNTVNGDGFNSGDIWGFHGFQASAAVPTPVRLYVNAQGVQPVGTACAGGFGNVPVLGARQVPQVGNQAFAVEAHGLPPGTGVALLLNAPTNFTPIELGPIGMAGCTLHVDPVNLVVLNGLSGTGDAQRATATANFPLPIPNDPRVLGNVLVVQAAILDLASGRPTPITMTNGLRVTVQ